MVDRKKIKLPADPSRVILRYLYLGSNNRIINTINRVLNLTEGKVENLYEDIVNRFYGRHRNFESALYENYKRVEKFVSKEFSLSELRKLLIGAYFSCEYSIESAALFNPSMVPHPDQSGLNKGEMRFIMSLRATGEGHISSVEFRSGVMDANNNIMLDEITKYASMPVKREENVKTGIENADELTWEANYNISFSGNEPVSERVIFPFSRTEKNGIEDVRLVKFYEDDGSFKYYGTFTAYDGTRITSQMIQTDDFVNFQIRSLHGSKAKDKGMALFPQKINGKYTIISRLDGENLYFMQSDNIFRWENAELFRAPVHDWEFVQIGNSGSPIKTEKGWILLTHSVGPLRRYVISALLLDIEDPKKIIGYLDTPLLEPDEIDREGYVPNVVYSCGGLVHNDELIIPYAMSDSVSSFAGIKLSKLFQKFIPVR
ncbi:MAG: glycoside hydrolase family 130 protein [Ignavibacteriaceae bacterium]